MNLNNHNQHLHPLDVTEEKNEDTAILDTYRYVDGRRFHNVPGVKYFMPNDEQEVSRLEMGHLLIRYLWQSNFSSPIHDKLTNEGAYVLDVGCGPGTWLLDMAETYPKATFIGIDISPMFPTKTKFQNVTFLVANVHNGLPFEKVTFDFVFQRHLSASYTDEQWEKVINELLRVLKPGGYLELMECDHDWVSIGPTHQLLQESLLKLFKEKGINVSVNSKLEQLLKDSHQLVDIHNEAKVNPLGSSGGRFGELMLENKLEAFYHVVPYLSAYMGLSVSEFNNYLEKIPAEINEYKSYFIGYRHWGRKI